MAYKKILPKDIFISYLGREATEAELWAGAQNGVIHHKKTGNEFLDYFADLIRQHMQHGVGFYAKLLGVTTAELTGCIKVLTGIRAETWIDDYIWLCVYDVLLHTDWKNEKVAQKMGYRSIKSFSRSFVERNGLPPTHWRWKQK